MDMWDRIRGVWNDLRERARRLRAAWLKEAPSENDGGFLSAMSYVLDDGVDWPGVMATVNRVRALDRAAPAALTEAVSLTGLTGQTTYGLEFDKPYKDAERMGFSTFVAGQEWDMATRDDVLSRCHQVAERNPLAIAGLAYTVMYTVGKGSQLSCKSLEVQEVLEKFAEWHEVDQLEKDLALTLQVDGELFLRFFERAGVTSVAVIPAWDVRDIVTDPDDRTKPLAYRMRQWRNGVPELVDVPAGEVLHKAVNKYAYELRGRPDLFGILPWLKAYRDMLEDRIRKHRRMGAFLWHVRLKGATGTQITAKQNALRQPPPPGSIVVSSDAEEWEPMTPPLQAGDADLDMRAVKNMAVAGLTMAEFMFGSGSDTNLATGQVQFMPVMKRFERYQDVLETVMGKVYRRVVENAVAAGPIPERVQEVDADGDPVLDLKTGEPRMIDPLKAFDVKFPDLTSQDVLQLTNALEKQALNGWVDDETAISRLGYDPQVVKKKLAQQRAEKEAEQAQAEPAEYEPGQGGEELPPGEEQGQLPAGEPERQETGWNEGEHALAGT